MARASEKSEAPFLCPKCQCEVILRKGRIKIHHFSHKPPVTCSAGKGETEEHLAAKLAIYDALKVAKNIDGLEIEKNCGASVADVFAVISGIPVAIEIQRSDLSVNEIVARTKNYYKSGISVLWAGLMKPSLLEKKYGPRAWEKWAHAAYFGRVYYWEKGQTFRAFHFDKYTLHQTYSEWYDENGDPQSAGGYDYSSSRWRTPNEGKSVVLSASFRRKDKDAWSSKSIEIPRCTLYMDNQPPWWKSNSSR